MAVELTASLGRRVRVRALQTSAMLGALLVAGPAFAQCAPDPTVTNGTTTCAGTDANGLRVTTYGTMVTVQSGATVLGGGQPGIAIALPSSGFGSPVTVSVAGQVNGGTQPGISLLWQPPASGFGSSSANLALTLAQGGSVTGTNALVVGQAGSGSGNAYATIDNAGTLTGTSGIALLSTAPSYAGFSSITNRASGFIGVIVGPVGTLTNAGAINGGSRSAVDWGTTFLFSGSVTNTGTIASASTAATLANLRSNWTVTNSGQITNSGSGAALSGDSLVLTHAAAGRITSSAATAISANTFLTLTNAGTITGNVVTAASPSYTTGSTVDSSTGTINGSVTFGAGNDTLVAGWNGSSLVTGITGAINGGAGTDTVRVRFAADTSVGSALTLPTSFERLTLAPDAKVTATLVDGFSVPAPLQVTGGGTVVNRTTLTGTAQALQVGNDFSASPIAYATFVNAGSIRTTAATSGTFGVLLGSYVTRFENSGTIATAGDGVSASSSGAFVNTASGSITAGGTGVSMFGSSFTNAGTIRSTAGTGVILSGSSGSNWTNSGRIDGTVAGARISSNLVNTGTIAATTTTGTGVLVDYYGILDNRAGGIVNGGVSGTANGLFNAAIINAGTINGSVRLTGSSGNGSFNANRYFALTGGTLNGNLTLGGGDVLVADLAGSGAGRIAGITGTVTGTDSLLRLRVRGSNTTTLAPPTGFAAVGYDLYDGATLTLTGNAAQSSTAAFVPPLTLAGQGTVDINATITAASQPAIQVTSLLLAPGETAPTTSGLAITSRGALTLDRPSTASFPGAAVTLGGSDSFTNAGTITVRDRATTIFSPIAAISGGKSVTNTGTITLDAATGVTGAQAFANSGSILQAAGGRAATGVSGVTSLTNSGTIDVAGNAVLLSYTGAITNSGRLASSTTAAIAVPSYNSSYGVTVTNQAGGTIVGGAGQAVQITGGTLSNAGTITGSVDLGYAVSGRSFTPATYIANGGTIAGDLRFGAGDDIFVAMEDIAGVSGTIDGGAGTDTYIHARSTTGTVTLGALTATGFEREGVRALGTGTTATIAASVPVSGDILISGDGTIVNTATLNGAVRTGSFYNDPTAPSTTLTGFTNSGTIVGGFTGTTTTFVNSRTIGSTTLRGTAVLLYQAATVTNSGTIANDGSDDALFLSGQGSATIANTGTITGGGVDASLTTPFGTDTPPAITLAMTNGGTIKGGYTGVSLSARASSTGSSATITLDNSGTIEATAPGGSAVNLSASGVAGAMTGLTAITLTNAGTIRSNGGGSPPPADPYAGAAPDFSSDPAGAVLYSTRAINTVRVVNTASGLIEASGAISSAMLGFGALDLANAGTIRGGTGTTLGARDTLATTTGSTYLAGAIQTLGNSDDRIVNTGSIFGSIALGNGNDRIENRGRIEGNVFLGAGDDTFLQAADAVLIGTVDGGAGTDSLIVDATRGGAINGDQFVNFERFSQIGTGNVAYSGTFRFDTIGLSGGTITVAAGQTLSSTGATTITGSDGAETVVNAGTIAGAIDLGAGNDRVVNTGTIQGAVLLGTGEDQFVEGAGSRVAGIVDGGSGDNLYTALLAGDRSGLGRRTNFSRLSVEGSGTLNLGLDQNFQSIALAATGLNLTLNGFAVGTVTGTDAAETLTIDGDVGVAMLGAGNDTLALGTTRATGLYMGGTGIDTLRFTANAPVTLAGTANGFERIALTGNTLTIAGTLGAAGDTVAFADGDKTVTVANGGTLNGTISLGAGNDGFRLAAGATLNGTVSGGAGTDTATLELAGDRTLASNILTDFEVLGAEGTGTLTLTGSHRYDRVAANTNLAVATGASLVAPIVFGSGDNRLTLAGTFAGSVDGGAGNDTIQVAGGTSTAPVAFTTVSNVEALGMTGGYATVSGNAAFGTVDMSGGRLVGLAGSTIQAGQIAVRSGATFGSAGTVTGNIAVAGILSPGASPGTMTVNGNVALAGGSVSLFEITPTVADQLRVNGSVSIASGATLRIVADGQIRPGTSYDLIIASGGISGSYTTIDKAATLFGFVVQRADRIQLLGQFLNDATFNPQVARSVAYANTAIQAQPATSTLFNALPSLLLANGSSDPHGFARLTPEPYASATQLGIDQALTLSDAARGLAFAPTDRDDVHAFTFASGLGQWHTLAANLVVGTAQARTSGYGFLGGVGIGNRAWSVGAFAGYLDSRQRIDTLAASTRTDGVVAGVHARYAANGVRLSASVLYDGGDARTTRTLPNATGAFSRYGLHSWVSDLSAGYAIPTGSDWALTPKVGVTYIRTTRDRAVETGSIFALTVARDRHVAGFADAGFSLARAETSDTAFRPYVGLGLRAQIEGRTPTAIGGYAGTPLTLLAVGAQRAQVVGTASAGIAYRTANGLELFSSVDAQTGRDDHRESISTGVRLRF